MIAAVLSLVTDGCGGSPHPPVHLLDGSEPPSLPAALRHGVEDATTARVAVLAARRLDPAGRSCVASFRPEFRVTSATTVVRRTGTLGESLTFTDAGGDVVLGCDRTTRRPGSRGWCGRSVGRVVGGRLRDVRLDIGCRAGDGRIVGFGWIEPGPATLWIGVRAGRSTEIDRIAAGLPVRVLTTDVDQAGSSAAFRVVEYTSRSDIARRYRVRAGVAG